MAKPRKRGNKWFIEICVNGTRKSKTCLTKAAANMWAAEMTVTLSKMIDGVSTTHTLSDIFARYLDEVSDAKKGARWEAFRLNSFNSYPLASIKLVDVRREDVEQWITTRLKEVKASTVNRELNLLSHCFTSARRWRLMSHNPMTDLQRPRNPPARDRRISDKEVETVLVCLGYDERFELVGQKQRVAVAFLLAIETAMRAGEIASLLPENINLVRRTAYLVDTKNGLPRYVPLSKEAVRLLERLAPWGDTVMKISAGSISTLFKKYVDKSGIDNLRFHDTRHEAITRLASKLDVLDLARAVGHRDIKQLLTYYNKSAEDLAKQL